MTLPEFSITIGLMVSSGAATSCVHSEASVVILLSETCPKENNGEFPTIKTVTKSPRKNSHTERWGDIWVNIFFFIVKMEGSKK